MVLVDPEPGSAKRNDAHFGYVNAHSPMLIKLRLADRAAVAPVLSS
jgi:hypothetical protein